MAMKNLLTLARRSQSHLALNQAIRPFFSLSAVDSAPTFTSPATPSARPPNLMPPYGHRSVIADPTFLKIRSAHHILSAVETTGLRLAATESSLLAGTDASTWREQTLYHAYKNPKNFRSFFSRRPAQKHLGHYYTASRMVVCRGFCGLNDGAKTRAKPEVNVVKLIIDRNFERILQWVASKDPNIGSSYHKWASLANKWTMKCIDLCTFRKIGYSPHVTYSKEEGVKMLAKESVQVVSLVFAFLGLVQVLYAGFLLFLKIFENLPSAPVGKEANKVLDQAVVDGYMKILIFSENRKLSRKLSMFVQDLYSNVAELQADADIVKKTLSSPIALIRSVFRF